MPTAINLTPLTRVDSVVHLFYFHILHTLAIFPDRCYGLLLSVQPAIDRFLRFCYSCLTSFPFLVYLLST